MQGLLMPQMSSDRFNQFFDSADLPLSWAANRRHDDLSRNATAGTMRRGSVMQ
jgi:hypothetical protein